MILEEYARSTLREEIDRLGKLVESKNDEISSIFKAHAKLDVELKKAKESRDFWITLFVLSLGFNISIIASRFIYG